jgi:hypothetical protein
MGSCGQYAGTLGLMKGKKCLKELNLLGKTALQGVSSFVS